jgi:hypothetical protein
MENLFLRSAQGVPGRVSKALTAAFCVAAALSAAGCATEPAAPVVEQPPLRTESVTAVKPAAPPVKQLTADARAALQNAEQSVNQARAQQALWTSAVQALEQAKSAANRFDNESVLRLSTQVNELVRLSLKQRQAPPVKLFD